MKHALPQLDFKRVAVEFDNLILTKYHGLKQSLKLLSLKPHSSYPTHAPHQSADESAKMMVAGLYADKAVKVGLTIFLLKRLRQISSLKSTLP